MMKIDILYEDTDIVAINKPAGLVVHSDGKTKEPLLTDWIVSTYPKAKKVGEPLVTEQYGTIDRPGVVHRLDRETSGVLLIAKTKKGYECLKEQFKDRTIQKTYIAFVYGEIRDAYGVINRPIGRSPRDFRRWSATRGARGEMRPAETWYTLLAYRTGYSLLEIEPKTGRTHQIRVHFKAINHPVLCDGLYAPEKPRALGFHRTALHAASISFKNCKDKTVKVSAPVPQDFHNAFEELGIQETWKEVAKNKGLC